LAIVDGVLRGSNALFGEAGPAAMPQDSAAAPPSAPRSFDIRPGPLDDVLAAFEATTGVTFVLGVESIGSIQSPGVAGTFTTSDALRALLEGTNVTFRFTSATSALLELRIQTEAVEVTGRAPEATVSSPKYTQPIRDVPQTIQVIPQAIMTEQGVTTLSEALRNVPGITLQAGEGGGASNTAGDMFNMRGFNASNSLFVDGVRDDGLVSRDVFNLEQVEVFMGPTGSDVGRGTAAGYVNMLTKTPHLNLGQTAELRYGSADQKRITLDANQALPFGDAGSWISKSAVRLNAMWQDGGVPGRQLVEQESRALAPSLALGLDTRTRATFSAQFLRQDNLPDYGIPGAAWSEEPLTPTTTQASQPVDSSNYYGSVGYDYDKASQDSYLARIEHDLRSGFTLRNQTRYNRTERDAVISTIQNVTSYNPVTELVTIARQGNIRENSIASNQSSVAGRFITGSLRHSANAGFEYTHEQQIAPTLGGLGTRAPASIYTPKPYDPVTGYAVAETGAYSKGWTDTAALCGFDTIELGSRWQINGGIRFEYYDTEFRAVDAAGVTTTDQSGSDGLFSGKVGVLYRINSSGNFYVSYGTVVTPPGAANFTLSAQPNNQNNPNVKPQESNNLEAGSKWDFLGGRLSLNGAVFRTRNKNVIFTVDATAVPPIYNQDDGQRVNGVTVGVGGRLTNRWQMLANFGYLDTAQESQNPLNDGNRLTLTPEFSGSVWTTYEFPAFGRSSPASRGLTIGGGLRATDDVYINAANTIQSPGYALIDALVEYPLNQHLSLRLNIYNLTDEVYIRNVNNNGGRYNPGAPRSFLLSSGISF
jgi:catecholate siderophore receptor